MKNLLRGDSELSVILGLGVATLFAVALSGLFYTPEKIQSPLGKSGGTLIDQYEDYTCCDTGNGNACTTVPGKTITHNGQEYGLLRSNMYLSEGQHVRPVEPTERTVTGERVFYIENSGGGDKGMEPRGSEDVLYGGESDSDPNLIPKQTLIYVCRSGDEACDKSTGRAVFDGYWKIGTTIPNAIKFCTKRPTDKPDVPYKPRESFEPVSTGPQIVTPTGTQSRKTLQIGTFGLNQDQSGGGSFIADWLTPYCKPAIYLYPEQTSQVSVKLAPQGKLSVTIPSYPPTGWRVIAEPSGDIFSQGKRYDYLYYEAKLPDEKITQPESGYVVSYGELEATMTTFVTDLGLNSKEKTQFVEYWMEVLPHSPYYFLGVIPESELDVLSPLDISPTPSGVRRVTLYFEALTTPKTVAPPTLFAPFSREGFSVVEWGGIFKMNPEYPFSCFM